MSNQKGFGVTVVLVVIAILSLVGFVGWRVYRGNNTNTQQRQSTDSGSSTLKVGTSSDINQAAIPTLFDPHSKRNIEIHPNIYYWVLLTSDEFYFGKATKINDEFLRLAEVAYKPPGKDYTMLGGELHGPEAVMYIYAKHIKRFSQLSPDTTNYNAINEFYKQNQVRSATDAFPSQSIVDYLKAGQYQAFFFSDRKIYFARVNSLKGNFLAETKVYSLRVFSTDGRSNVNLEIANNEDLKKYTVEDLMFWENLRDDSQVSKAITEFEKAR